MQTLFQALPVILEKAGADDQVREQVAFAVWRRVAGESIVRLTAPERLAGDILWVAVDDRTWKSQLEKLAPEYIARMARLIGSPLIRRLEFRVDPAAVRSAHPPTMEQVVFHRTAEIANDLRPSAEAIQDSELRRIFLQAAAHSIERSGG